MNYSQYLEQHQQLTKELDGASKEFEDLRSSYDSASPEARSNLEPELKESMNRVEAVRSDLSSLESQNPQHEADRVSGVVAEQKEAIEPFEIMDSVSDLADKMQKFAQVLTVMTTLSAPGADLPLDYATVEASPTVQTEQKPIEESKDIGEGLEDIETLRGGPKQQKDETEEQVNTFRESSQSNDDAYTNARSREDILDKFEQSYRNDVPQLENQQQQEQNQGISY